MRTTCSALLGLAFLIGCGSSRPDEAERSYWVITTNHRIDVRWDAVHRIADGRLRGSYIGCPMSMDVSAIDAVAYRSGKPAPRMFIALGTLGGGAIGGKLDMPTSSDKDQQTASRVGAIAAGAIVGGLMGFLYDRSLAGMADRNTGDLSGLRKEEKTRRIEVIISDVEGRSVTVAQESR